MPSFCRHNRFIHNCPICQRDAGPQLTSAPPRGSSSAGGTRATRSRSTRSGEMKVRRLERSVDDGYRCVLVAGLRATADAERFADELAFSVARLARLAAEPPGLYATIAAEPDPEEARWTAFLLAYLSPTEGEEPFAGIEAARTTWASGELPSLDDVPLGPRTSHDPARGDETCAAYRAWAERGGGQTAALAGEATWSPERRFERLFQRLSLPGFGRTGRFDLLTILGALGLADVRVGSLRLGGADETTVAAKRVFGIGDSVLLERRAAELAVAADVPLEALDLALENWARPARTPDAGHDRVTLGVAAEPDGDAWERVAAVLELA